MFRRMLKMAEAFRAGFISAAVFCALALTTSISNFLVAATNLPSPETLHILSRALHLDPGPDKPVTMVMIDEVDYAGLGEPVPMRKSHLAALIDKLRPMKPKAILVDFDISSPTASDDMALLETVLSGWSDSDPLLMFPRELTHQAKGSGEPSAMSTAFDQHFLGTRPIFWISSVFQNSEGGGLDEWNLWTTTQNSCEALLSPQLLLYLWPRQGSPVETRKAAACLASAETGGTCAVAPRCDSSANIDHEGLMNRRKAPVRFVLGDDLQKGPSQDFVTTDGKSKPAFYLWSSGDVLSRGIAAASVQDRIVIIGGAYAKAGDRHDTPIGRMDGARVLANAISTGDRMLEARHVSDFTTNALTVLLATIALVGFLNLKPIFFGLAYFASMLAVYAGALHLADANTAVTIVRGTIGLTAILIGVESVFAFVKDLLCHRLGWRAFLNNS
ncbi:CHASE2 domain-containing protein [Neorhizobium galegae]|uniref:CHASE2 domain-containing protein n=1 Tax=Neorhizobium galegae TaxID=399 RepID=UPI0006226961|nr:CHASE2 domain-containing protein [Neorhizobium galegae]CDZ49752.1 CHASE2 domain protein [Neorhizobium galegae bv. orientalis]